MSQVINSPHLNPLLLAPKITVSMALRCGRTKGAKGTGKAWLVPLALANCNQFSEPPQKVQVLQGEIIGGNMGTVGVL